MMIADRETMVRELAGAAVSGYAGAAPVGDAFDAAAAQYEAMDQNALEKLYSDLKEIDRETGYEIVFVDADLDFAFRG